MLLNLDWVSISLKGKICYLFGRKQPSPSRGSSPFIQTQRQAKISLSWSAYSAKHFFQHGHNLQNRRKKKYWNTCGDTLTTCASFHPQTTSAVSTKDDFWMRYFGHTSQIRWWMVLFTLKKTSTKQCCESSPTTEAHSTEQNIFEDAFLLFSRAIKRHSPTVICKGKTSFSARNLIKIKNVRASW